MKFLIPFIVFLIAFNSCSSQSVSIYYNNISKNENGKIYVEQLNRFFIKNKNIKIAKTNSNILIKELNKIKDKSKLMNVEDVYYDYDTFFDYAFILNDLDTLYSNQLFVWIYKNQSLVYKSDSLKIIIKNVR